MKWPPGTVWYCGGCGNAAANPTAFSSPGSALWSGRNISTGIVTEVRRSRGNNTANGSNNTIAFSGSGDADGALRSQNAHHGAGVILRPPPPGALSQDMTSSG